MDADSSPYHLFWDQRPAWSWRFAGLCLLLVIGCVCRDAVAAADPPARAERLRALYYEAEPESTTPLVARMAIQLVVGDSTELVPWDHAFRSGDRVRFEFSSNRDGYTYVFCTGPDGQPVQMWPERGRESEVQANIDVIVPSTGNFRFDEATGEEQITILVSPTPLNGPAIQEALATHAETDAVAEEQVPPTDVDELTPDTATANTSPLAAPPLTASPPSDQPAAAPLPEPRIDDAAEESPTDAPDRTGQIVNIALRTLTYDPPEEHQDPHVYFSSASDGPEGAAAIQFTLKHE